VAVQIGNEITNGFLWNNESLGQACEDGGRLWCSTIANININTKPKPKPKPKPNTDAAANTVRGSMLVVVGNMNSTISSVGTARWAAFGHLISRGIAAVRTACPTALVAIHTDLGNHIHEDGINWVIEWCGAGVRQNGTLEECHCVS
jgi:arabinogalactan endo-1,4-beta-galactosidase